METPETKLCEAGCKGRIYKVPNGEWKHWGSCAVECGPVPVPVAGQGRPVPVLVEVREPLAGMVSSYRSRCWIVGEAWEE